MCFLRLGASERNTVPRAEVLNEPQHYQHLRLDNSLLWKAILCICKMFSSIPTLYLLCTSGTLPLIKSKLSLSIASYPYGGVGRVLRKPFWSAGLWKEVLFTTALRSSETFVTPGPYLAICTIARRA